MTKKQKKRQKASEGTHSVKVPYTPSWVGCWPLGGVPGDERKGEIRTNGIPGKVYKQRI